MKDIHIKHGGKRIFIKYFRQDKFTLKGGQGGSQNDNGQDPSSHFPGELV